MKLAAFLLCFLIIYFLQSIGGNGKKRVRVEGVIWDNWRRQEEETNEREEENRQCIRFMKSDWQWHLQQSLAGSLTCQNIGIVSQQSL